MKRIVFVSIALALVASSAPAQMGTATINRHDSFSYRNRSAENLGYAQAGLTAFLALLDSGTGTRQNGVPAPGYPSYPGPGPGGAWPPAVLYGPTYCSDPSWCTVPSPLGPGPGSSGFAAGYDVGRQWARERRVAEAIRYHTEFSAGIEAGAAGYGW